MPPKRKATSPVRPPAAAQKRRTEFDHSRPAERTGVIQRKYYPSEISSERCAQYNNNEIPRPLDVLTTALHKTLDRRTAIPKGACVVHWFKRDLRLADNRGLDLASVKAQELRVPLIAMFLLSPQDYEAHRTSPARVDFDLRSLAVLQRDLGELDIPLYCATVDRRRDVPAHVLARCREWDAKHVFCNIEYEVDELRRETKLVHACLEQGIAFDAVHDDTIVPPGALQTGAGKQFSVYSPWYRAWVKHLHSNTMLFIESDPPSPNPPSARKRFASLFGMTIPPTPPNKLLPSDRQQHLASLWPAGEHEAYDRLERFVETKISSYKDLRDLPSANGTSKLSVHLNAGTLSPRVALRVAQRANSTMRLDGGDIGTKTWIGELAWRDFYKHVLAHWPYICMSKPFKYEYADIEWNDVSPSIPLSTLPLPSSPSPSPTDLDPFTRWRLGQTGFPIIDAAMRHLLASGTMPNRLRMLTASFLAKDLLLDWRLGEAHFMLHLIDGDFAANNGGWGFSASCGVDPQPYFRIFNPVLQSEKFDEDGRYIHTWVEELKGVEPPAVHDPYHRGMGKEAKKNGYPEMMLDHAQSRKTALERYKTGLGRGTANVGGGVHN